MSAEKPVREIMQPLAHYPLIREDDTLLEALQVATGSSTLSSDGCLLVTGESPAERPVIKGFVTKRDLVYGLTEHFLKGARSSGAIFWEGQLEAECREGIKRRVREIMTPLRGYVRETDLALEAIFLLNQYNVPCLPVVHQEDVTGLIRLRDILQEMARLVIQDPEHRGDGDDGVSGGHSV